MTSGRKQTKEWEPWFNFSDDGNKVTCVYCGGTFSYKRERAFAHYGYRAKSERAVCSKLPRAVRHKFSNCANFVPQRMNVEDTPDAESGPSEPSVSAPNVGVGGPSQSTQNEEVREGLEGMGHRREAPNVQPGPGGIAASNSTGSGPLRQQRMLDALNIAKRKALDEKWASFFYEANVPFNVVRHPAFIEAVRATSLARFEYSPPSYHQLRTQMIEPKKLQIENEIKEKTAFAVQNYGVTICTDGWDDINRRPLMNVMMSCPTGDVFLGSIDTTGENKTMAYIADQLKVFIERVGPNNVTQICTDNAKNMLGAMEDIIATYPHIFKQGCAAHALDLLLEDWAKMQTFKELLDRARKACQYIKNHHATMATFRELSPNLQLLVPNDTRFATHFLMMQRLVSLRTVLLQLITRPRVLNYVATLRGRQNGVPKRAIADDVIATIADMEFWQRCSNYVHIATDVVKALRVFDGREPAMGKAWLTMTNLRRHVHNLTDQPFFLPNALAESMESSFDERWSMTFSDLHYAGALLNPFLADYPRLKDDGVALRALYRVVHKLKDVVGVRFDDVMLELTQYEERTGPYSPTETPNIRDSGLLPHQWWNRIGDRALSKIAKRVLSLTCSASSCERNWSMFSFVHNRSRNRLAVEKAESLVYIYTNNRVLRQRQGADPLRWYDLNNLSEDSDSDALGPVPVHEANREFDAMLAEDAAERDEEVNRAPPAYEALRNLWREGADHLQEARNYYGDEDGMEDGIDADRWGHRVRRSLSPPPNPPNEGIVHPDPFAFPSDDDEGMFGNPDDNDVLPDDVNNNNNNDDNDDDNHDDNNDDNQPPRNGGGNVNEQNDGSRGNVVNRAAPNNEGSSRGGVANRVLHGAATPLGNSRFQQERYGTNIGNIQMLNTIVRNEANVDGERHVRPQEIEDDDVLGAWVNAPPSTAIVAPIVEQGRRIPRERSVNRTVGGSSNAAHRPRQEELRSVGNAEVTEDNASNAPVNGRDPQLPNEPVVGDYRLPRSAVRGGRGGRNAGRASSSRPPKRPPRGIGARRPVEDVLPFLQTPPILIHGSRRGPTINSDAEDPTARRHKRLRKTRIDGRRVTELRNENSEFEDQRTEEEEDGSEDMEDEDNEEVHDEAPADEDVHISQAHTVGPSTGNVRRSSRLSNIPEAAEENEGDSSS